MDKNEVKKRSSEFLKKYKLTCLTTEAVRNILQQQGYTLVRFNNLDNTPDVESLITSLGIEQIAKRSKGFTYADSNFRLVFVHEGLSDEEECLVLAHEEGHIFLNHIAHAPVLGNDVQEEFEANEFARYVTAPPKTHEIRMWIRSHKEATFVLALAIIVSIVAGTMMIQSRVKSSYWTDYYITETGTKYHRENCIHIKGKDSVKKMTKQQLESGAYKPCGVCLPNE